MNIFSTLLLAYSLSADAFAVAASKGCGAHKCTWRDAVRMGGIFGSVEALTATVGFGLGSLSSSYIEAFDHWIAFAILSGLGLKMIVETFLPEKDEPKKCSQGFLTLALTAIGTSIDSLGVGVTLAFMKSSVFLTIGSIFFATFSMATIGVMLGHALGEKIGRWAEVAGGVVLIGIGAKILMQHLGYLPA